MTPLAAAPKAPRASPADEGFFMGMVHNTVLAAARRVADPQTVLDVGCGTGGLLRKAKEMFPSAQLIGVDPDNRIIELARSNLPEATFHVGKVESLPLQDSSIDLALSTFSFHHWADPSLGIRQVARVLKQGAPFLLADLWPPYGFWRLTRHFWPSRPERVAEMFVRGGMAVESQQRKMAKLIVITMGRAQPPPAGHS